MLYAKLCRICRAGVALVCCYQYSTCDSLVCRVLPAELPGGVGSGKGPWLLSTKSRALSSPL